MAITKLVAGNSYGTKAKDIYLQCCQRFGWDARLANEFGMMQPLYGHRAADNGTKDVWFICHSNCKGDILVTDGNGVQHHRNYVHTDSSGRVLTIEEYQQDAPFDSLAYPLRDRITFVKNKRGQYIFVGTYRAKEPNSKRCDRTFYRVGYDYIAN